jgi:hypothetical protein
MKDREGTVIEAGDTVVYASRRGLVSGVVHMVIDRNKLRHVATSEPGKYKLVPMTDSRVYVSTDKVSYYGGSIVRRSENLQVVKKAGV